MKKATVYSAYVRWGDDSLSILAGRTLASLTGNVHFPDPRPDLDEYALLVNDYRQKQEIAGNGGSRWEKEARDNAKAAVVQAMKELPFYVNTVAKGNREMLASSGFEIIPEDKPAKVPAIPGNARLIDGSLSGEMRFIFNALQSAREYEYCYATDLDGDGTPDWGEIVLTTNSRLNYIQGLTPGQRVYARVRARNGKGIGDWSEPVSLIAR